MLIVEIGSIDSNWSNSVGTKNGYRGVRKSNNISGSELFVKKGRMILSVETGRVVLSL